jgi:hypothetical protein
MAMAAVAASSFTVVGVTNSSRCECVVSSGSGNEAIFGLHNFALINVNEQSNEQSRVTIPVHLLFDSSVGLGMVKISRTVLLSLSLSLSLPLSLSGSGSGAVLGTALSLEPIGRPPSAARAEVSLVRPSQGNALLTSMARATERRLAALCLRHQPACAAARFALTDWLSATVTLLGAGGATDLASDLPSGNNSSSSSSNSGGRSGVYMIDWGTELVFSEGPPPAVSATATTTATITADVSAAAMEVITADFVGSSREVAQVVALVFGDSSSNNNNNSTASGTIAQRYGGSAQRCALLCGESGAGKSLLLAATAAAAEAAFGAGAVLSVDLTRLREMERWMCLVYILIYFISII